MSGQMSLDEHFGNDDVAVDENDELPGGGFQGRVAGSGRALTAREAQHADGHGARLRDPLHDLAGRIGGCVVGHDDLHLRAPIGRRLPDSPWNRVQVAPRSAWARFPSWIVPASRTEFCCFPRACRDYSSGCG